MPRSGVLRLKTSPRWVPDLPHDVSLISTIAVGLAFAFVGGYVAVRLGLPPLVGYLLAGVAVGPFTPGFVADAKLAPQLAEIGVILLMFGVGMHFSVRDLLAVRNVAVPGALVQVAAVALTCGMTRLWGWSLGPRAWSLGWLCRWRARSCCCALWKRRAFWSR